MRERPQRWLWLTLLVSMGLHALALLLIRPTPPPRPAPEHHAAVELAVEWLEPAPMTKATAPATPARSTGQRAGGPATAATPTAAESSSSGARGAGSLRSDVPLASGPGLAPGLGVVLAMPEAADAELPRGVTLHNTVMDQPDPVAVREYEGEVLSRQLTKDLARDVAAAANAVGTVPPFFRRAESAMKDRVALEPPRHAPRSDGAVARDVAGVVLTPSISAEAARRVADTPLGRSIAMNTVPVPNLEDQRFRESALQLLAMSEAVQERAHAVRLRTVLELVTDATGAVADATVLERSGDLTFDESALHLSRKVLRELPETDDRRLGTSWWRSRWQFTWEPPLVRVRLLEATPIHQ